MNAGTNADELVPLEVEVNEHLLASAEEVAKEQGVTVEQFMVKIIEDFVRGRLKRK